MQKYNKTLISVIIPIYNAESYLRECLDSILNQTFDINCIEVIMVNDGSVDRSKEIANEYVEKYYNFTLINLPKSHKIAGYARNQGIKVAKGEFLMFSDSDDLYDKRACELMYNAINKYEADMITANYQNINLDGTKWENPIFNREKFKTFKLLEEENYTNSFFVLCSSVCPKIFRKSFIDKHNIKFLEGVPAEDAYFTFSVLLKSSNIYYLEDVVYYYRRRNLKAKQNSVSWNLSKTYFEQINIAYKKIYELFEDAKRLDFYRYFYAKSLTYMLYKFIDSTQMCDAEKEETLIKMTWFYEKSTVLKVDPVQKSVKILIDKIIEGQYHEVLDICNIIREFRTYLSEEVRENMSKPMEILYERWA